MFLSYAMEWLAVAVGGLGLLLGILIGRSWGVRRRIELAVQDAETSARTDPQTGLWNRRGFADRYNRSRDGRRRSDWPVSVLFIDVDRFKSVNDTHGHPAGDHVIGCVGHWLGESCREHDTVARLGGDEFVALLLGATLDEAVEVAERIRSGVESMAVPTGQVDWNGTVSVGVIEIERGEDLSSALERVDRAVYAAKEAGRNRVVARPVG